MRLALGPQALVAGLTSGFPADRGSGGHVQDLPGLGATAADAAAPAALARVAIKRRHAEQGRRLAAREGAEFGQLGAQAGGRDGAAAGHGLDDLGAARQSRVGHSLDSRTIRHCLALVVSHYEMVPSMVALG